MEHIKNFSEKTTQLAFAIKDCVEACKSLGVDSKSNIRDIVNKVCVDCLFAYTQNIKEGK